MRPAAVSSRPSAGSTASTMSRSFAKLLQRREPVRPIGLTADQPHQDAARLRQRALDIGVDRQRMTQLREIGEPQRRQAVAAAPPAGRERGEIGIRIREHHEIGRVLADVPWCRGLLKTAALAEDDVHQIILSPALIAASSISPCSPITTSFDCLRALRPRACRTGGARARRPPAAAAASACLRPRYSPWRAARSARAPAAGPMRPVRRHR